MTAASLEIARVRRQAGTFLRLVQIEHSVFALPFAYVAALTAMKSDGGQVRWGDLVLITIAMVAARTFAMAANRVVDRELDARNPRTAKRELVTGVMSTRAVTLGAGLAALVFMGVAAALSMLCLELAPVALLLLGGYPYAKRVTWACHGFLGLAQAAAPIGAWIAVTNHWSNAALLLGLAVGTWIGGFDLIYALQDIESDRINSVHSLPARFGARAALNVSVVAHFVTFGLLIGFGVLAGFGAFWYAGLALTAVAFGYEHAIVTPTDLSRINRAFFTANGFVGITLFVFAVADLVHRGLGA